MEVNDTHLCAGHSCQEKISNKKVFCKAHWNLLPKKTKEGLIDCVVDYKVLLDSGNYNEHTKAEIVKALQKFKSKGIKFLMELEGLK